MAGFLAKIDRRVTILLIVLSFAIALLSLQWLPPNPLRTLTARGLQLRLHEAPDAQVAPLLAKIAELDDQGLPRITVALGDERPVVALAARDLLQRRFDQWSMLPRKESTPHVAQVAKTLAAVAPSLGAERRAYAAQLAERILVWPVDRQAANIGELIADCESVLKLDVTSDRPEVSNSFVSSRSLDRSSSRPFQTQGDPGPDPIIQPGALPLPGASLPTEPAELTFSPQSSGVREFSSLPNADQNSGTGYSTNSSESPAGERLDMTSGSALRRPGSNADSDPLGATSSLGVANSVRRLPDVELMQLLHHETATFAVVAIDELKRRGFQARHLRLARRLTDADPAVRRLLAADLPGLTNVDAKPWLMTLTRDNDASVRNAATEALAQLKPESYRDRLRRMKAKQDSRTARRF